MLGHIKLGQRVMLGFIFVLGLLLAVSFIGRYVMADAIDRVDKANALNALITDILQARPDEKTFIQNETSLNIRSVLTRISRLRVQATTLKAKFEEAENINQIVLVEKKIVEFLKSFLTFVNTIRLEKEVIFYMQQTSNLIIQHTKRISHYLGKKLPEKTVTGQNRLQRTSAVKKTSAGSLDQADLYTAEAKKIKAFEDLIAESAIFKQTDTRLESMRYPGFYERKIISLLPAMTHLKGMVTQPDMRKTIEESILFINRYRHMMLVFNNLNQKQVNEHRRMTTAADEMHQVCSSVSREQNDIVKKKIAFAHRMSLMFIMGGALMGLLIGLLVTVSTSKAVNKIRAVEKALRQSDERFELVLEATTDGVWDWDVPSDKAYCSPTYYAMLGYWDGEIQPQTWKALWLDLIHPGDRQIAMQTVQAHIEKRDDSYELEFRMAQKSGRYIWIYDRGRVTQRDPQGKPIRVVGTLVDISRRKQMEEDLKQAKDAAETANKAKSVFLANMSHELRTPLNAVLGFSQLMRKDSTITRSQSENLDIINKSGEHLLNLINDVLDVSKIEAGRIFLEEKEFDLSNMIMDITDMMQYRANSKGLKLRIDRSSNFPRYIFGDQAKMRQILLNLLSNAIKYTKKGFVILRLNIANSDKYPSAHLHLEVEDSGIGISRENRKKIFEPFEQIIKHVDAARGTGLGLAITRQYVELMAGKITVVSKFGKGSIFRVDLPVETVTDQDFKRVESSFGQVVALEEGQPSYRILIVEDNLNSRKLLREILERVGFTVREAITGQEAVDIFKEFHPHLIWMDRRLPGISGLAATRRIKKLEAGQKTIIVALTASVFKEQRDEVLAAGCDDFVSKPFQEKEILETIARHLNVRYRYAKSSQNENHPPKDRPLYHLTDHELKLLPDAWAKAFRKAVRAAQGDVALGLVEDLNPDLSSLAIKLKHLIESYRFDMLVEWIEIKHDDPVSV